MLFAGMVSAWLACPQQVKRRNAVEYDKDKVDEMVLALLYLTSSHDKYAARAWKGLD